MIAPKVWLQKYVNLSGISDKQFADQMTFAGNKVEAIHKVKGETVFEFEITSNRPDALSIIGLAREAAAVFNKTLKLPKNTTIKKLSQQPINLKVVNKNLCPTYSIVEIDNVIIKPSSQSIQKLLKLVNIRPVNNIVDITNMLMWQTGQPMHAFDADKIKGNLILRAAKPKEKIIPLDHKQRLLKGGEIIIEDQEKLVDLAGLMGGLNTEISHSTKKVYLHVPIYNPVAIRRASKFLRLRSGASTRFEKKLSLTQTRSVAKQAIKLIAKETGGQQSTKLITVKSNWKPTTISLSLEKVNSLTGHNFTQPQVDKYLDSLEIKKVSSGYQPPAWRRDIQSEVDLIEEIARLYGYNQLTRTLPTGTIPVHPTALRKNYLRIIKNQMAALGYTETYSSTLISKNLITSLSLNPKTHLQALHPMSKDYEYMRSTIIESILPFLKPNLKHTQKINLFELGTIFHLSGSASKLPDQPLELGLLSTTITFPQLKGQLNHLANTLNLTIDIRPAKRKKSFFHPSNQAEIYLKTKSIGILGQTLDKKAWLATLNVTELIKHSHDDYQYPSVSAYPPIIEDLTLTLPKKTHLGPIVNSIKNSHKLIQRVRLTKTYNQNYTFNIIYQSHIQALNDKMIAPIRKKIVTQLAKKFKAKLVGKL